MTEMTTPHPQPPVNLPVSVVAPHLAGDLPRSCLDSNWFFNRELSWLSFNHRILDEAANTRHPILERVRFLAIAETNLDEFFMVRVAGLKGQIKAGITALSADGKTPAEQLALVRQAARVLGQRYDRIFAELRRILAQDYQVLLAFEAEDIADLTPAQHNALGEIFEREYYPLLTPLVLESAQNFPFIQSGGFSLLLELIEKSPPGASPSGETAAKIALISLPPQLPRFIQIPHLATKPSNPTRFMTAEQLICRFLPHFFPDYELIGTGNLRINRDSEVEIAEEAEDLVRSYETALSQRKTGSVIRLVFGQTMPSNLRQFAAAQMTVAEADIYDADWVGFTDFFALVPLLLHAICAALPSPATALALKFPDFTPAISPRLLDHDGDMFAVIRAGDLLLQHPYQSFDQVIRFLDQAADDPWVIAIKLTLYRTSNESPIIKTLIKAAAAGKSVTALVELKARFDEEANLRWAKNLEQAGVQVVYGFPTLKTHAKLAMVVRRESSDSAIAVSPEGMGNSCQNNRDMTRAYVHIGTGNYHPITAKTYTDVSLFSCDPRLTGDATRIFNFITSHIPPKKLDLMALSPLILRQKLLALIDDEIAHAKAGRPAEIWLKLNALVDPEMIAALYRASQAGVTVTGIIRGMCCLRPGISGLSEHIEIRSLVGRFLEHGRVVCFGAGYGLPAPEAKVFISSADWMERNLNRRVEILVPILDEQAHRMVLDDIMLHNLRDTAQTWQLQANGDYRRLSAHATDLNLGNTSGKGAFSCHSYFLAEACGSVENPPKLSQIDENHISLDPHHRGHNAL